MVWSWVHKVSTHDTGGGTVVVSAQRLECGSCSSTVLHNLQAESSSSSKQNGATWEIVGII